MGKRSSRASARTPVLSGRSGRHGTAGTQVRTCRQSCTSLARLSLTQNNRCLASQDGWDSNRLAAGMLLAPQSGSASLSGPKFRRRGLAVAVPATGAPQPPITSAGTLPPAASPSPGVFPRRAFVGHGRHRSLVSRLEQHFQIRDKVDTSRARHKTLVFRDRAGFGARIRQVGQTYGDDTIHPQIADFCNRGSCYFPVPGIADETDVRGLHHFHQQCQGVQIVDEHISLAPAKSGSSSEANAQPNVSRTQNAANLAQSDAVKLEILVVRTLVAGRLHGGKASGATNLGRQRRLVLQFLQVLPKLFLVAFQIKR